MLNVHQLRKKVLLDLNYPRKIFTIAGLTYSSTRNLSLATGLAAFAFKSRTAASQSQKKKGYGNMCNELRETWPEAT